MTLNQRLRLSVSGAAALAMLGAAPGAFAHATSTTQATIDALNARVTELESQQSTVVRTSPGLNLTFGGYIKTDFIYDVDQALGDSFAVGAIATDGSGENPRFRAHARQSRLFFTTDSEAGGERLTTRVEFDFFGGGGNEVFSNSYRARLRHAYAQWGNWLVGQTWSTFMPLEAYPSTIDFEGPAGIPFIRQAQVRYTAEVGNNITLAFALENSEFSGRDASGSISESTGTGIRAGLDGLPDFVASATYSADWGLIKVAGLVRELNSPNQVDTKTGWGINLSGKANLWEGGSLNATYTTGDGIGRYIINGFAQDAYVNGAGQLTTIESSGATLGVAQDFSDTISGALAIGYYTVNDTFASTDIDNLTTVHASLFWKPADRITVGAEVIWGEREDVSGATGDNVRLQTSFKVSF